MRSTARRQRAYLSEELIPVTWIKQYHFCPRIIYFLGVLGVTERTTESMFEGKIKHLREEKLEKRRKTLGGDKRTKVKRKWTKLYVASERLGVVGVIDEVVEINGKLAIVEVKHSKPTRKPPKHHLYQAVAYAMLAEEALRKPIRHIILRYVPTGETYNIEITEAMKKHVKWTIKQINKIINNEKMPKPPSKPKRQCHGCGWYWICKKV